MDHSVYIKIRWSPTDDHRCLLLLHSSCKDGLWMGGWSKHITTKQKDKNKCNGHQTNEEE